MTATNEEKLERGRAVWEMTQTEGWQIIRQQIEQEIQIEASELLDCPIKEDLEHKQLIKAYKKVLRMVETVLSERDQAADNVRGA